MTSPIEFASSREYSDYVLDNKNTLDQMYSAPNTMSTDDIAETAVEQNTYRGIHGFVDAGGPKKIFAKWAKKALDEEASTIASLTTQTGFDAWLESLADKLRHSWPKRTGDSAQLNYGQSRKLTNLLMRQCYFWNRLDEHERKRLIGLLHVPLDEYVLVGLRQTLWQNHNLQLGTQLSMSSVVDSQMYATIQGAIRDIARSIHVPAIYLDIWPLMH